jgi:hypothetical protein
VDFQTDYKRKGRVLVLDHRLTVGNQVGDVRHSLGDIMKRREFIASAIATGAFLPRTAWGGANAEVAPLMTEHEREDDIELFTQAELKPEGMYYRAEVPDTLDLAERGRLAVRGLINFADPDRSYEPYQIGRFNSQPAYMSHYGAVGCEWGGITEGLLMARHMSGSMENLAEEESMFRGVMRLVQDNGEFAVQTNESWLARIGRTSDTLIPKNTSRMMMALMAQYQLRPSTKLKALIVAMADSICNRARVDGDYASVPAVPPIYKGEVLGPWLIVLNNGTALRGLSRTYALTGDKKYLEVGAKLRNTIMKPEYWVPEAAPKAVEGGEHGAFDGHIHSFTGALMGLLWYSSLTNDAGLKEFVRESYEFVRTFGIARMGLFGENCVTGDMTWLALKLSDLGVGDYWEDADQYVRNHMVEAQLTDAEALHRVNVTMPQLVEMQDPTYAKRGYTMDRVIDRFVGAWRSDGSNPANTYPQNLLFVTCCTNNNPPAMHAVWEATIRFQGDTARVNLLLNRVSPWLDMDSHLPYEGKVVLRNKAVRNIFVRIPRWVDTEQVTATVNGKKRTNRWVGRYLFLDAMQKGDTVQIEFPIVETAETFTLKWRPSDRWLEVANPGYTWRPDDPVERYTLHLRGNTVVDVSPRIRLDNAHRAGPETADIMNAVGKVAHPSMGDCLPLYERMHYRQPKAPTHSVKRYVSPVTVHW